jgi:hypothetical protein
LGRGGKGEEERALFFCQNFSPFFLFPLAPQPLISGAVSAAIRLITHIDNDYSLTEN